ncbi:MAG TPA: replication-relaxation family protein [Candidatus Saccharimonadales bacterium]
MKLPKITTKQQEILELLYRYRYLDRIQIQSLMGHKDKRRVIAWLKDLRDKDYVEWIYSTDFIEKSKPAIYYLGINGVRYLKTVQWDDDGTLSPSYPLEEVRKRYKDKERSRTFIHHSLLIADRCIGLEAVNARSSSDGNTSDSTDTKQGSVTKYKYLTEADYLNPDSNYHFLAEHEKLRPSLCIIKQKGSVITSYLLEIFDATLPSYRLRFRLKAYVDYLSSYEWEGEEPQPLILLVFSNLNDLIYAKRRVKKLLLDEYYEVEEIPEHVHIHFTTTEKLKGQGISGDIWENDRK